MSQSKQVQRTLGSEIVASPQNLYPRYNKFLNAKKPTLQILRDHHRCLRSTAIRWDPKCFHFLSSWDGWAGSQAAHRCSPFWRSQSWRKRYPSLTCCKSCSSGSAHWRTSPYSPSGFHTGTKETYWCRHTGPTHRRKKISLTLMSINCCRMSPLQKVVSTYVSGSTGPTCLPRTSASYDKSMGGGFQNNHRSCPWLAASSLCGSIHSGET